MFSILKSTAGITSLITVLSVITISFYFLRHKRKDRVLNSVKNESKKPLLIYKKGKFIKPNLSKLNLTEANIRMNLIASHMYYLEMINTIIVDENGQLLIFPIQFQKSKNYIEGIALAA